MNLATISCAIRAGILTVVTTSFAVFFTFHTVVAKDNKMTVKMSPEYTRQKKASGRIENSAHMKKEPQVTKTPSPGGPVAIPYPN